ncbi:uncharacterized protein DSM5745_06233 [Aspergillus mulundensis]|uniref:Uncharacterized protein n=1 Tax=Aspergillus mulundensis TaxID=1810919 RepID=A0A3D8RR19_9EURO|nr:Uncharacterized protein DSM5745_06233 [Aspergillus mulundensis]RDW76241.1 Uncharacterized protein DSM5745_06233 [Aspergillus mulundensis]
MSSETLPISPAAFAEAIKELTLPVLYTKVAELQNSIAHLRRSNQELRLFITESCESEADKHELEGYIAENEGVERSMNERIHLCKAEVEGRGQIWIDLDMEANEIAGTNGPEVGQEHGQTAAANGTSSNVEAAPTERSRDREDDGENGGVYL